MCVEILDAQYKAIDIAKYIVDFCTRNEIAISDLKLQKILYYIQLAFISNLNKFAFKDELEAWKYGPVVKNVYDIYSSFGSTKICLIYDDIIEFKPIEKNVINSVLLKCLPMDVWELVEMTHVPDGPWEQTYCEGEKNIIRKDIIKEYALSV